MVNMIRSTQANIAVSSAIGLLHVQLKLKKEISFVNFDYGIDDLVFLLAKFLYWTKFEFTCK